MTVNLGATPASSVLDHVTPLIMNAPFFQNNNKK